METRKKQVSNLGMASQSVYQIVVKGVLDEHWKDCFNGTLIKVERKSGGCSVTRLTCQTRDQAELMGILNRLNSLNLPLLEVIFLAVKERNPPERRSA